MRILFTSNPLVVHVYPMLPLMHAARDGGHEVVMATGAELLADVRRRGFTTWKVGPDFAEVAAELAQASTVPAASQEEQLGRDAVHLFARPSVRRAHDLLPRARAWQPDIVIGEITELAGREVAAATGAVYVTHGFGTQVPNIEALAGVLFDHFSRQFGSPNRLRDFMTGTYLDPCPPGLQLPEATEMDAWPVRPGVGHTTPADALPPQFAALPGRPLVYVTLGTVFNDSALAGALLDAIQDLPISIAMTTGPNVDPSAVGPRPANVATAAFVPQALVLPLASAVVSHAGSGTMLGALSSGLPQVCLPQGADQFANAARVAAVGAGLQVLPGDFTPDGLRAAVQAVLQEPGYAAAASTIQAEIVAMPSAASVLDDLIDQVSSERRIG